MIGTVDVTVQAAKPDFPLSPFCAFVSSPSSVRVRNVPRRIGTWDITAVSVSVDYPDGTTETASCVLTAGVWVGTVPGCETPGDALRGFVVRADGIDETGDPVTGYVLGVGDVEILNRETALTPGVVTFKGDPGPQGPQGERGPEGPQGPKGDPGSGGTMDYEQLENKPSINGHTLAGASTLEQIGAQKKLTAGENITITADGTISATGGSAVVESEDNPGFAANADFAERAQDAATASAASSAAYATYAEEAEHAQSADVAAAVAWSGVTGKPDSYAPSAHASTHAAGGGDPITPTSIGALPVAGGTLSGDLTLYGQADATTLQVGAGGLGGKIEVYSGSKASASIKKDGAEVATEDQLRVTMQLVGNDPYTIQLNGIVQTFDQVKALAETRNAVIQRGQGTYRVTYIGATEMMWDVTGAVAGNVQTGQVHIFDQDGQTVVQRVAPKVLATEPMVDAVSAMAAYPIETIVGGVVKDRTVNVCEGGGVITFPGMRTDGCVRDFVVRVPAMDTAPTVVFPSYVRYESWQDAGDIWTAEAGKANEWYFSESEPGVFKVVHQALGVVTQ